MFISKSFTILTLAAITLFSTTARASPVPVIDDAATPTLHKRSSAGWNDWSCKPSSVHPLPIVLVHGLGANGIDNWAYHAPRLVAKGYCVYSLTYGVLMDFPLIAGLDRMENSAQELNVFVDKVLAATGSTKVDMVGHSEGSVMPKYYLKFLGGAAKVHKFAAFGAIVYGTSLDGLIPWGQKNGLYDPIMKILSPICKVCPQLETGSDFLNKVNADGDTVPGVGLLNIVSKRDEFVTPYTNGEFKETNNPLAISKVLQDDYCRLDQSEHLLMAFDPVIFAAVYAFLNPSADQHITCLDALAL